MLCKQEIFYDVVKLDTSPERLRTSFNAKGLSGTAFGFDVGMLTWDFSTYVDMTASYSPRSLKYASDAHNAIAGALNQITRNVGVHFVAAMPVEDLHNGLLWFHASSQTRRLCTPLRRKEFPTWSWLGWEGVAGYGYWLQPPHSSAQYDSTKDTAAARTQSIIDRGITLYRDIVQVSNSAVAKFESVTPNASWGIMVLSTEVAWFRVHLRAPTETTTRRRRDDDDDDPQLRDGVWEILDCAGNSLPPLSQCFDGDSYVPTRGAEGFISPMHRNAVLSFTLGAELSARLLRAACDGLEFVALQRWTDVPNRNEPEAVTPSPYSASRSGNVRFGARVWVMVVSRRPDGLAERLAVIWLPLEVWLAADPQPAIVKIV